MSLWSQFTGGAYTARSTSIAAETAINVYTETREVPGSPKQATLYGTPGQKYYATATTVEGRGWFSQDGQTWTVVGDQLYEVNTETGVLTARGTITDDGKLVSWTTNGQGGEQLGIVAAGKLYVLTLTTNVLAEVALPFSGPVMITFLDTYGLINQADSPIVWFSALEDLTAWDALDFFTRSGTSDNIVGIAVTRDRVWALGSKTTTQFYDSGDSDTPFVPYPGTTTQIGLVSASALAVRDDTVYWIATSESGQRKFVSAVDPATNVLSTPPIDRFLAACPTLADAELLLYQQEGHTHVTMTCPSSPDAVQSYTYDTREQLWHARAGLDTTTGQYTRWRARGVTSVGGQVYVGDYATGDLYTLDLDTYTDNGSILKRERTAPYLGADNQWAFLDQFELGIQPGVGLSSGQGSAPVVDLEISRDGAHTWVSAGSATLGAIGEYAARAIWRRLGRVRQDRLVIRVTMTDPVKCVFGPGAWLKFSAGTGQL